MIIELLTKGVEDIGLLAHSIELRLECRLIREYCAKQFSDKVGNSLFTLALVACMQFVPNILGRFHVEDAIERFILEC